MDNTTVLTISMTAYAAMENYKHAVFTVFLLLYLISITLNALLITVIHQNKELQQPMNVLACSLSVNEMYGSTVMLPSIMIILMSDTNETSVAWCKAQVFFLHTYVGAEFFILAIMGYDRYVAICYPLHYHTIMSHSRICKLVALSTLYPLIGFACFYSLTLSLSLCGNIVPKLYCVNMELVKNSCSNPAYISIVGLTLIPLFVFPQLGMIIFSYIQIARVCKRLLKESHGSALKTCVPHLISILNFTMGSLFEVIQNRFDMSHVSTMVKIFLSLYFVIIPSVSNPVLYGLGSQIIRVHILRQFIRHKILPLRVTKQLLVT